MKTTISLLLCLVLTACNSIEKTEPAPGKSTVVLSIEIEPPVTILGQTIMAQTVMLAKVTGENFRAPTVILSNYVYQGRIYALNLEPGDYVIVGTAHSSDNNKGIPTVYRTYFDEAMIRSSRFSVPADSLVPAGRYAIRASLNGTSDSLSAHYRNLTRREGMDLTFYIDYYAFLKKAGKEKADLDALKDFAQMDFQRFPPAWKDFLSK